MLICLIRLDCQRCDRSFVLCRFCFRNHVYCCKACSAAARRESKQGWQRAYRQTPQGRKAHCIQENRRRQRHQAEQLNIGRTEESPASQTTAQIESPDVAPPAAEDLQQVEQKNMGRHTSPAPLECSKIEPELTQTDARSCANTEGQQPNEERGETVESETELFLDTAGSSEIVGAFCSAFCCAFCGRTGYLVGAFERRPTGRSSSMSSLH